MALFSDFVRDDYGPEGFGRPIPGATVTLFTRDGVTQLAETYTDETGAFSFTQPDDFYLLVTRFGDAIERTPIIIGTPLDIIGPTGPSNNTRVSLAALKAAAPTDLTSLYDGSLWQWTLGDFTGRADDAHIVASNGTVLAIGAWVRRTSGSLTVNVRDYGATGDGVTDDRLSIIRAIEDVAAAGGGTVLMPAANRVNLRADGVSCYRISAALFMRSGVHLVGEGQVSRIYNDQPRLPFLFGLTFCILPGNYHPAYAQNLPYETCESCFEGVSIIRVAARVFAADKYSIGDTLALRGPDNTLTFDGFRDEYWLRLNEIVGVDPAAGTMRLKYPLDRGFAPDALQIAVADTDAVTMTARPAPLAGTGMFVMKRGSIRNLCLRSNESIMGDTATFECLFEDLWLEGYRGVYLNLCTHSTWNRINVQTRIQAIEASQNCHDTAFTNFDITLSDPGAENFQIVSFNESAARVTLDGFRITAGQWDQFSPVIRIGHNAERCVVRNGSIHAPNAGGALLGMDVPAGSPAETPWITRYSGFDNIDINGGTAGTNAILFQADAREHLVDNFATDIRVSGNYLRAGRVDGVNTTVDNCRFRNAAAPLQIMATAYGARVRRNEIPGGIEALGGLEGSDIVLEGNTSATSIAGRAGIEIRMTPLVVTSTTPGNEIAMRGINAGVLEVNDVIAFEIAGNGTGAGGKNIALADPVSGFVYAFATIAGTDAFNLVGKLTIVDATTVRPSVVSGDAGARREGVPDLNVNSFQLSLRAWCDVSGDTIAIDRANLQFRREGYA